MEAETNSAAADTGGPMLRLEDVHKCFGRLEVLRGVTLDVKRGSVVCVLGPSGSGKSTLLRCINLLEPPDDGRILLEGKEIAGRRQPTHPWGTPGGGQALSPLGFGGTIATAAGLVAANFSKLLTIAAAVVLPLVVLSFVTDLLAFAGEGGTTASIGQYEAGVKSFLYVSMYLVSSLLFLIAYLLIVGATFKIVADGRLGQPVETRASFGLAWNRLGPMLGTSILGALGVLVGFLLLIVPGIYLLVAWAVAIPVVLHEGLEGGTALGRSREVVRGRWWPTFAVLLAGGVVIAAVQFGLTIAGSALTSLTDESLVGSALVLEVLGGLATLIAAPLAAALVAVIYYDLRVREEGQGEAVPAARFGSAGAALGH